jgi:acyl carrier protein
MVTRLAPPEVAVMAEIRGIAVAELKREGVLDPDDDLVERLQLDSLTRLTLIVAIEDRFRVALPDDELARVRTLAELARLVARLQEAA